MNLNPSQLEAVHSVDKRILIVAGAGTGKTNTITAKIVYMIESNLIESNQVIATTFTNKAANELKERLRHKLGYLADQLTVGTFHSISLEIIQKHGSIIGIKPDVSIISGDDQIQIIRNILTKHKQKDIKPGKIFEKIQRFKEGNISTISPFEQTVLIEYNQQLSFGNMMDFADIISSTIALLKTDPNTKAYYNNHYKMICVDEYQDINNLQNEWIKLIVGPDAILCCVGDPDQAIYGFRGANCKYILDFEAIYPKAKIIKLECNYRCKQKILDKANSLISCNKKRIPKSLYAHKTCQENSIDVVYNPSGKVESAGIARAIMQIRANTSDTTIAILVRGRSQIVDIEESLLSHSIPYVIVGAMSFIDRAEVKDMVAYLKFMNNKKDGIAFARMLSSPRRGIGDITIQKIIEYANEDDIDLLEAAIKMDLPKSYKPKFEAIKLLLDQASNFKDLFSICHYIYTKSGYQDNITEEKEKNITQWLASLSEFASIKIYLERILWHSESETNHSLIQVMTIHSSKGLEFDYVFLPGWEEGVMPYGSKVDDEIEEERRLAYVALTRAKNKVFVSYAGSRLANGMMRTCRPSRFIRELGGIRESMSFMINNPPAKPKLDNYMKIGQNVSHPRYGIGNILDRTDSSVQVRFIDKDRILRIDEVKLVS